MFVSDLTDSEGQAKVYELWLGHELISYTYEEIKARPDLEKDLKELERQKAENELRFFHPHGQARFGYDCGFQLVSMVDWINDTEHTVCMNCSPNQVGKTCQAIIKKLVKILPCKPEWPIFKNGVKFREWQGPKTMVMLGYDKGQLKDVLWPELQKWIPAKELGDFAAPLLGGTREPSWERNPRVPLKCGSRIIMLTYDQKASVCAGVKSEEILPDEQMPLTFFMELDQRGRTRGGVWWDFPYTPHAVEGRPDSGAESWLNDMWRGTDTRGHSVLRTRISVDDVPDHIFSKEQKRAAYIQHVVNPKKTGDQRAVREGQARYYGIAQQVSGLYYPEFDKQVHLVDWTYDDIKNKGWTHYRAIDWGTINPTAVSFWAVSPVGELFMYDEYYVAGLDAIQHAPKIIEHSGNERKLARKMQDKNTGIWYDVYEEVWKRQRYIRTWLDWHSFQNAGGTGQPTSFFFHIGGLAVCESTKLKQESRAQNVRAMLKIDPQRKHMVMGNPGAPRLYISRKCVKFMWEMERCIAETRVFGTESHNPRETKRDKDDHLIDTMEYLCCENPRYIGSYDERLRPKETTPVSRHGGY